MSVIIGMPKHEIAHRGCCTWRQLTCNSITPGPHQLAMDAGSTVKRWRQFALCMPSPQESAAVVGLIGQRAAVLRLDKPSAVGRQVQHVTELAYNLAISLLPPAPSRSEAKAIGGSRSGAASLVRTYNDLLAMPGARDHAEIGLTTIGVALLRNRLDRREHVIVALPEKSRP